MRVERAEQNDKEFWIRWLAVSAESRRKGLGRLLVATVIFKTPRNAVLINTFAGGSPGANAAGGLYRACGFEPTELWEKDGVVRQRYVRKTASST
ncbi:GNAT family N-acetyltransferase [Ciceribacter sp. RN22]|uniref:GNAT family N-acetyltransferase n=1 Tax=Ciceribacter sp. RN22 TaxID=2954932 RepID=UPI0035AF2EB2